MLSKQDTPATIGEFEALALTAVIAAGSDAYGARIQEEIEGLVSGNRLVSIGQVYVTLDRLEDKGYVKSWRGESTPERGGKAKRYYEVQASGHRVLRAALEPMAKAWQIAKEGA